MPENEIITSKKAIHGTKSAAVESHLKDVCSRFYDLTLHKVTLSETASPAKVRKALEWTEANPHGGTGAKKVKTSLKRVVQDVVSGNVSYVDITLADLQSLWENPEYSLRQEYPSPRDFLILLLQVSEEYARYKALHRLDAQDKTDPATEKIYEGEVERSVVWVNLGESLLPPTVNPPDREFLYDRLRRNCGTFYWITDSGVAMQLHRKEQTGEILEDDKFWGQWRIFAYPLLDGYAKNVIQLAEIMQRDAPTVNGLPQESLDRRLLYHIPRVVLENIKLGFKFRKEPDAPKIQDGFTVELKAHGDCRGMALSQWQDRMARCMLTSLSIPDVKELRQFSNTQGEGITWFDLSGINIAGTSGRTAAENRGNAPSLPPMWSRYLMGEKGNMPIFEGDPEMSLLRLAYFVSKLVDENGYTRQILYIAGSGNDGKTALMETLADIMGSCSCVLNASSIESDTTQYKILNKSLICIPEVSNFIKNGKNTEAFNLLESDFIKKVTGRDTITLRKLYCMPIDYKPEHAFVIATTNKTVYARGRAAYSRLLPLAFTINYTLGGMLTPTELKTSLLSEKTQFIQWCFDTVAYYQYRKNKKGETLRLFVANGIRLLTDDLYHRWLDGAVLEDPSWSMSELHKAYAEQQKEAINNCSNTRFLALDNEDSEADDRVLFEKLFNKLFECDPEADFMPRADVLEAIIKHANDVEVKAAGISVISGSQNRRYHAFLEFISNMEGVQKKNKKIQGNSIRGFIGVRVKPEGQFGDVLSF